MAGIAMDLFHFLQSHSGTIGDAWQGIIDKWYKRVEATTHLRIVID